MARSTVITTAPGHGTVHALHAAAAESGRGVITLTLAMIADEDSPEIATQLGFELNTHRTSGTPVTLILDDVDHAKAMTLAHIANSVIGEIADHPEADLEVVWVSR